MKKHWGFILIIALIVADQLSKWYILEYMLKLDIQPDSMPLDLIGWYAEPAMRLPFTAIHVLPFMNLVMVWNDGISFGMLDGFGPWPLIIVAVAICGVFLTWMMRASARLPAIASAMIVGGALGNVIDRLRFGAVADFLDFHAFGYHYPAFNLADSCITVGIALLLFDSLFLERNRAKG